MRLDQKIAALAAQPLLAVLEPAALHVLAFSATEQTLKAGEELFRKGDASNGGFLVLSGRLEAEGQAFAAGTLVGEAALVAETQRPVTVLALEPTVVMVLTRSLMRKVLESHPASAVALSRHVAARVVGTEASLKAVLALSPTG